MHGLGFSLVYATAIGAAQNWFPAHMKVSKHLIEEMRKERESS